VSGWMENDVPNNNDRHLKVPVVVMVDKLSLRLVFHLWRGSIFHFTGEALQDKPYTQQRQTQISES